MIERIRILFIVITAAAAIGFASTAQAQEFLKDKTLTFIVGYSPGGTYDQYTRLIARHINKHVSGNPTRVVENMPGAGGIIAANHLYNRVKPDGLTIAAWASPLILQHVMATKRRNLTAAKWAGSASQVLTTPRVILIMRAASEPWTTGLPLNDRQK